MVEEEIPIHLVLGSGGARGLTHIGVIRVLQEQGYAIKSITGCSMGGLVGALFVSGHLDEYEEWVCQLTRWDVLRFLDLSLLGRSGMVKGDRLIERLSQWLSGVDMESLPIPLTVVAADIASRKEVWISKGDLMDAVRASIAVPGVFSPLVTHGRVLVDGGILNPLPIPPNSIDTSAITVAVSLSGRESRHPFGETDSDASSTPSPAKKAPKGGKKKKPGKSASCSGDAVSVDGDETVQADELVAATSQDQGSAVSVEAASSESRSDGQEHSASEAIAHGSEPAATAPRQDSGDESLSAARVTDTEPNEAGPLDKAAKLLAAAAGESNGVSDSGGAADSDADNTGHQPIESFLDSLQRFFGRDRSASSEEDDSDLEESGESAAPESRRQRLRSSARPALTDVMLGMFNTMQDTIARHQLASNPPDILIDIPCNICQSHDFHKAKELIPAGAYWARRALVDQVDNARE